MLTACVVAAFWIITQAIWDGPFEKKEWWQDREKRLKNEALRKQAKMKAKKG